MRQIPDLLLVTFLAGALAYAADRFLELRGQIDPAPSEAAVTISAVSSSFTASAAADAKGRFRFRKLPPGPYIVTVVVRGAGMSRRSVDVTPSLADAEGRVHATIPFSPSQVTGAGALRGRNTVSVGELAIPDRARSEYDQAQKKLSRQDVPGATNHLKRAVELAPQYMAAWTELGTLAARGRNWVEAETYYRKALELRPGAVMLTLNLAGVLIYLRKYEEALGYNRFAVERSPNNALANAQLGMTYFLLERDDEALKYLKIAKSLDPSHYSHPQLALADIYLKRGDQAAATGEFEDFLARHPDAPNAQKVREEIARIKR